MQHPPIEPIRELLDYTSWCDGNEPQVTTAELLDLHAKGEGYIDGVFPIHILLAQRQVRAWLEACGRDEGRGATHEQNEADARAAGYPNLISMQQELAGEQHPDNSSPPPSGPDDKPLPF